MADGSGSLISGLSYLAIGRETTLGTYTTCTTALDFLSASLKTTQEAKILEQIQRKRTYSKHIRLMKVVDGEVEFYPVPRNTATGMFLQNAFGGTVTSATATGETTGGLAFTHTFELGSMDQSYPSLCINMRKGDSTNGFIYNYSGMRINELNFTGELEEPLKCNVGLVGIDSTTLSNDVESALAVSSADCLSFVEGRISIEPNFSSLTSSAYWEVQSMEFGLNNSLKSDNESRRVGSDLLQVLPAGIQSHSLNLTMRFDDQSAYNAMIANSTMAAEIQFQGDTITTSVIKEGIKFQFPKIFVMNAGDPEVSGPDNVLTAEVTFGVLRDDSSAGGYALQALLTNDISSYA